MTKTKKVGSTGRFGPRYGRRVKLRTREIEKLAKAVYNCPKCKAKKVTRKSSGIWSCSRCGTIFAGGAYTPVVKVETEKLESKGKEEKEEGK